MNNNQEVWKTIDGYNNYEVSSFGRIRNNNTFKILKQSINSRGYYYISLSCNSRKKSFRVARLIAFAFCENNDNNNEVDHIDRDKNNNHYLNLRWVSKSINCKNKNLQSNNTSNYRGVSFEKDSNKWMALWNVNKKRMKKRFDNKEDAIAYRKLMEQQNEYSIEMTSE